MNINDHINYWIESAEHDLETAKSLFSSEKFDWSLFFDAQSLRDVVNEHLEGKKIVDYLFGF